MRTMAHGMATGVCKKDFVNLGTGRIEEDMGWIWGEQRKTGSMK